MIQNLDKNRILWLLTGLLSLIASLTGVVTQDIYSRVVSTKIMPGVLSQDLMTIVLAGILLFISARVKEENWKKQVIILGIIGYLFYGYGIYVIERLYTMLYFVYMAIFGLSFYSLIYGVSSISPEIRSKIQLPAFVRRVSVAFLLLIPVIFYPLWVSQLLPLVKAGQKIEFIYSVYILDLCFIMPAFIIIAVKVAKNNGLGLLLAPALFVVGFTLLFPLVLGEFLKPIVYRQSMDAAGMGLFLILSILFFVMAVVHLRKLKISGEKK